MEPEDMLDRFRRCHRELEKVHPGPVTNCRSCPLDKYITITREGDDFFFGTVTFKIRPCAVLSEMAMKIKGGGRSSSV